MRVRARYPRCLRRLHRRPLGARAVRSRPSGAYAPTGLRLLTPVQYQNSIRDSFGEDVPVAAVGQWRSSIAAAQGGVSVTAVEEYEAEARAVSSLVFGDSDRRLALTGCEPLVDAADPCVRESLEALGRHT